MSAESEEAGVPFAVVDVHYFADIARAACVVAAAWTDDRTVEEHVVLVPDVAPYVSGRFFERELPCILAVLPHVRRELHAVVIDGYVDLDEHGAPGLGAHLFIALGERVPVIGVAKTAYAESAFATPLLRGTSARPLYVTARGTSLERAVRLIASLHGAHRIPTLLERADHLARGLSSPSAHE